VSKSLPTVLAHTLGTASSPLGAVQAYQTEAPAAMPRWSGSPGSRAASTLVPVTVTGRALANTCAFAMSSLSGGDACAAGDSVISPPAAMSSETAPKPIRRPSTLDTVNPR
jgi:hypothetical protein